MSRGFTLIEVVLYIGLLGVLMVSAIGANIGIAQELRRIESVALLSDESQFLLQRLRYAALQAHGYHLPATSSVIFHQHPTEVAYRLVGGIINEEIDTEIRLSSLAIRVNDLQFTSIDPQTLRVRLALSSVAYPNIRRVYVQTVHLFSRP